MPSGDLDRRIYLYYKTVTYDSYGAPIETWVLDTALWAELAYESIPEDYAANQLRAVRRITLKIRYYSSVKETWKVIFDEHVYDIKSIEEIDRRRFMLMVCEGADNLT